MDDDKKNNLIMDETDESDETQDNNEIDLFESSSSSNEDSESPKKQVIENELIDENLNKISKKDKSETLEATNGINVFDNNIVD